MSTVTLPIGELGVVAVTRGLLGAGIGLLVAKRLGESRRRHLGLTLLLIGALSTIPLIRDVRRRMRAMA